jgi:hypothetical protein
MSQSMMIDGFYSQSILEKNTEEIQLQEEREIFGATHITHESGPVLDFGCLHEIHRRDETNADTLFKILDEERPFKNWIYLDVEALPIPIEKRNPDDEMANLMDADLIQRYPSPPKEYLKKRVQNGGRNGVFSDGPMGAAAPDGFGRKNSVRSRGAQTTSSRFRPSAK